MKKKILCIMLTALTLMPVAAKKQPAVVILTAGQSNTDGRVMNAEEIQVLPVELRFQ